MNMKRAHYSATLKPFFAALLVLVCARSTTLFAQQEAPAGTQEAAKGGDSIMLDLQDADLRDVLRMLALQTNCSISFGDDIKGKVTATLHDKTLEQAFESILMPHGYYWHKTPDDVYVITTAPPAAAPEPAVAMIQDAAPAGGNAPAIAPERERGGLALPAPLPQQAPGAQAPDREWIPTEVQETTAKQRRWECIPMKFISADEFVALFNGGAARAGGTTTSTPLGSMIASQMSSPMDRVYRHLNANPRATNARSLGGLQQFPGGGGGGFGGGGGGGLGNIGGGGLVGGGGGLGGGGGGQQLFELPPGVEAIGAYNPLNAVLVRGEDTAVTELWDLIKKIDLPIRQIEISAQFVEVKTEDQDSMGIDWQAAGASTSFVVQGMVSGGTAALRYAKGNLLANLGVLFNSSKAKIIASPKVTTQNNLPATLYISDEVPYFTQQIVFDQFGNPQSITFPDILPVETFLTVVPRVNYDGSVTAFVMPYISDIVGYATGPDGTQVPRVITRSISSLLTVKDGETIALAGFTRKTTDDGGNKVPILSDLPIIGGLFKAKRRSHSDSEMVIFMTPRVIWTEETLPGAPGYGGANP